MDNPKWISVNESLPKKGEIVLCKSSKWTSYPYKVCSFSSYEYEGGVRNYFVVEKTKYETANAEFWMSIPN